MATTGETVQATQERRSLEASLYMPRGGDYRLTLYREVVLRSGDEVLAGARDDKPITRMASQIVDKTVTVDVPTEGGGTTSKTYTGAEVMAALAAFFDLFDQEDNPPAAPAEGE